jgi:hypothetical protein
MNLVRMSLIGTFATCNDAVRRSARGGNLDIERTSPKDRV